jgi:assimilatory nitrate reductase catalytic subunit
MSLLMGAPAGDAADRQGRVVCACERVTQGAIDAAIREAGLTTVAALGEATGAGMTCGSCRPELAERIATVRAEAPAAAENEEDRAPELA